MSIQIGNYPFEGPAGAPESVGNNSGVYAVLTRGLAAGPYTVIDAGESGSIRDRLVNHDRCAEWARADQGNGVCFAADYCNEKDRMRIESELRTAYRPVCGVR
jgi:hypothetical protein